MKTHTRILIVLIVLVFVSMGAHFGTSSETVKQSPESADHPDIIRSSNEQEKSMIKHFGFRNLPKSLRIKLAGKNFKSYFTNEQDIQKQKQKNNLAETLIKGEQQGSLIINTTTILVAFPIQRKYLGLNFINTTSKTNFSWNTNYQVGYFFDVVLQLIDPNTIIVFTRQYFSVINLPDLKIRQEIKFPQYSGISTHFIDTFVKNESGKLIKTLLLGTLSTDSYLVQFNYSTNSYENAIKIYTLPKQLFLTDLKEGVGFWNYFKVPINLTSQFKVVQNNFSGLNSLLVSVVSNSEEIVLLVDGFANLYTQMTLKTFNKTSYESKQLYKFYPPDYFYADVGKIRFTNDDKFLFFNINHTQLNYQAVGVMNVGTGKVTYFDMDGEQMTDFTCFDYGILSDSQFVLVCQSLGTTQSTSAQKYYQLWLYNMSNFKLLDTYSVLAEATDLEIKTNPSFNSAFILQTFDVQNKPTPRMFQVVNNKITSGTIPNNFTNFKIVADCLNYIIGIFGDEPFHSFVNVRNFTVVKKTPIYDIGSLIYPLNLKFYLVQNNMIAICNKMRQNGGCDMYEFYDLSKMGMPGDAQFLCYFFVDTFKSLNFFLPKNKLVFQYGEKKLHGYDLQKCPTKKLIPLQIKHTAQEEITKILIRRNQPSSNSLTGFNKPGSLASNNLFYLLVNPNKIYILQNCQPYKPRSMTIIPTNLVDGFTGEVNGIDFSTNYKYLMVYLRFTDENDQHKVKYQIEIRSLNDLDKSLYKTQLIDYYFRDTPDVTEKDELVYATSQGVFMEKMNFNDEEKLVVQQSE